MTSDEWLRQRIREGGLVSGNKVPPNFQRGWGTHPFVRGMKAHHWVANREDETQDGTYSLRSACGLYTVGHPACAAARAREPAVLRAV